MVWKKNSGYVVGSTMAGDVGAIHFQAGGRRLGRRYRNNLFSDLSKGCGRVMRERSMSEQAWLRTNNREAGKPFSDSVVS